MLPHLLLLLLLSPLASAEVCSASVKEETAELATIANIWSSCFSTEAAASSQAPELRLSGTKGEENVWSTLKSLLRVDAGKLLVNGRIDRDDPRLRCGKQLECVKLIHVTEQQMFSSNQLRLTIVDINDNTPEFSGKNRQLQADENSGDQLLQLPSVVDIDGGKNGETRVSVVSISEPGLLEYIDVVSATTSSPQLRIQRKIDREQLDSFQIVLKACDQADQQLCSNVTVRVTVKDDNDNSPKFSQNNYTVSVKENVFQGQEVSVLRVAATDADSAEFGTVRYSLSPMQQLSCTDCIRVDSVTGDVFLLKALNATRMQELQFSVMAADGGGNNARRSHAKVTIKVEDINDHRPRAQLKGQSPLPENDATFYVGRVEAEDADLGDNGLVQCRRGDAGDSRSFRLETLSSYGDVKMFRLFATQSFDREKAANATMEVICWDAGQPALTSSTTFTIGIADVNEHPPVFSPTVWEARVREGEAGAVVAELNASDADATARLEYSVVDGGGQFKVVGQRLVTRVALDRELERSPIVVTVAASDGERTATAKINVEVEDVNDNAPQFEQPLQFSINETFGEVADSVERKVGTLRASDMDEPGTENSRVTFSFVRMLRRPSGDLANFHVAKDGLITATGVLDREQSPRRLLVVRASDHGSPRRTATATVLVRLLDVNDNRPEVRQPLAGQLLNITDAYTPGISVLRAQVFDADVCGGESPLAAADCVRAGRFTMRLRQRVSLFGVNSSTGDIFVLNPLTPGTHKLNLSVTDSGWPRPLTASVLFSVKVRPRPDSLFLGRAWSASSNWTLLLVIVVASSFITVVLVVAIVLLNRRQPCSDSDSSLANGKQLGCCDAERVFDGDAMGHSPLGAASLKTFGNQQIFNGHAVAAAYQQQACPYLAAELDIGSADSGHGASEEEIRSEQRGQIVDKQLQQLQQQPAGRNRSPGNYPYSSIVEEDYDRCHERIPLRQQQPGSSSSSTFCRQLQQAPLMPESEPNFDSVSLHHPDYRSISRNLMPMAAAGRPLTPMQQHQQMGGCRTADV